VSRPLPLLCLTLAACGGAANAPGVSIALVADDTHPCAGAVRLVATVSEVNGASTEHGFDAAVAPEQFDCDFTNGVAEAAYAEALADVVTGKPYTARVELFDSTGLSLALGGSGVFQAHADKSIEPVTLQLTRVVPVGTLLVDLYAEAASHAAGTLTVELLAGSEVVGTRDTSWPGDESTKRPLRITGLPALSGLRARFTLKDGAATIASFVTDPFAVGATADTAFASPSLAQD
jgi:hypothetical protein